MTDPFTWGIPEIRFRWFCLASATLFFIGHARMNEWCAAGTLVLAFGVMYCMDRIAGRPRPPIPSGK